MGEPFAEVVWTMVGLSQCEPQDQQIESQIKRKKNNAILPEFVER